MNYTDCYPRIAYDNCDPADERSYWLFYVFTMIPAGTFLILYGLLQLVSLTLYSFKLSVDQTLRFGIMLNMMIAIVYNGSLLSPKPYLGKIATEFLCNFFFLTMFLTLMLLIKFWIKISLKMNKMSGLNNMKYKIFDIFVVADSIFVTIAIVICDIIMAVRPELTRIMVIVEAQIWAIACIFTTIFFFVAGRQINISIRKSEEISNDKRMRKLKFKFTIIYWILTLGVPYAALHEISVFVPGTITWFICYSLFHSAGIIIAILLLLILGIKEQNNTTSNNSNSPGESISRKVSYGSFSQKGATHVNT